MRQRRENGHRGPDSVRRATPRRFTESGPPLRGGPVSVVIPPTLVSARRGAALACRAPRTPAPSPPSRPGRHPAAAAGGPAGRPAWRCRPSTAICCGVTVAGPGAAMSTSCWRSRACVRSWTPPASPPWSTGDSEGWPRPARAGTRRSGTDAPTTSARRPNATTTASRPGCAPRWSRRSGIWPTRGRCGAGVACCTGPGRLPGRRGAHLPRPMDPPHPDMKEASGHPH